MSAPQNVPWADNSNVHSPAATLQQRGFTLRAHALIALHDWRGLRHAQINEVPHSGLATAAIAPRADARSIAWNSAAFDGLG